MMRSPDQRWHEYRWLSDPARIGRAVAIVALVSGTVAILAPLLPYTFGGLAPGSLVVPFFAAAGAIGGAVSILDMRRRRAESAKVAKEIDALSTRILCLEERLRARSVVAPHGIVPAPETPRHASRAASMDQDGDLPDRVSRMAGLARPPRPEALPRRRDEDSSRSPGASPGVPEKRVTPSLLPPRDAPFKG